jgi:hypothetical protein
MIVTYSCHLQSSLMIALMIITYDHHLRSSLTIITYNHHLQSSKYVYSTGHSFKAPFETPKTLFHNAGKLERLALASAGNIRLGWK